MMHRHPESRAEAAMRSRRDGRPQLGSGGWYMSIDSQEILSDQHFIDASKQAKKIVTAG
jgi:hypothetical protein